MVSYTLECGHTLRAATRTVCTVATAVMVVLGAELTLLLASLPLPSEPIEPGAAGAGAGIPGLAWLLLGLMVLTAATAIPLTAFYPMRNALRATRILAVGADGGAPVRHRVGVDAGPAPYLGRMLLAGISMIFTLGGAAAYHVPWLANALMLGASARSEPGAGPARQPLTLRSDLDDGALMNRARGPGFSLVAPVILAGLLMVVIVVAPDLLIAGGAVLLMLLCPALWGTLAIDAGWQMTRHVVEHLRVDAGDGQTGAPFRVDEAGAGAFLARWRLLAFATFGLAAALFPARALQRACDRASASAATPPPAEPPKRQPETPTQSRTGTPSLGDWLFAGVPVALLAGFITLGNDARAPHWMQHAHSRVMAQVPGLADTLPAVLQQLPMAEPIPGCADAKVVRAATTLTYEALTDGLPLIAIALLAEANLTLGDISDEGVDRAGDRKCTAVLYMARKNRTPKPGGPVWYSVSRAVQNGEEGHMVFVEIGEFDF